MPSGPPASTTCGRKPERTTVASSPRPSPEGSPTSATSLTGAKWKSIAVSRCASACGWLAAAWWSSRKTPAAWRSYSCSPVSAARRRSPKAAAEFPDGIGWSSDVLAPHDQLLVVVCGGEEAAAVGVGEQLDHLVGGLARGVEPANVERRLVQGQERLDQVRVVLEVGGEVRAAVLVGAQQPAALVAEVPPYELGAGHRGVEVVLARDRAARLREGADHQRVPRAQPLVVLAGPDSPRPVGVEGAARIIEPLGGTAAGPPGHGGCCDPRSCPPR